MARVAPEYKADAPVINIYHREKDGTYTLLTQTRTQKSLGAAEEWYKRHSFHPHNVKQHIVAQFAQQGAGR